MSTAKDLKVARVNFDNCNEVALSASKRGLTIIRSVSNEGDVLHSVAIDTSNNSVKFNGFNQTIGKDIYSNDLYLRSDIVRKFNNEMMKTYFN